jgi:hypothetical protein
MLLSHLIVAGLFSEWVKTDRLVFKTAMRTLEIFFFFMVLARCRSTVVLDVYIPLSYYVYT